MSKNVYCDVLNANQNSWMAEARKLMEEGAGFVVVNVTPEQFAHSQTLVQEFNYARLHTDEAVALEMCPAPGPCTVGFVKKDRLARGPTV